MPYRIAGIDVHKKKLAVVVTDVEIDDEYQFERRWYGANPEQLKLMAQWMIEQQVEEVVMESTARYWTPVWAALEQHWRPVSRKREGAARMSGTLHLAQALSNRGRRGRKKDFRDAERLVKRLISEELVLSFVPDPEQRLWRSITRTKYQLTRNKMRLQNQLEALLEEAHIKLSSLVSDLLGASGRRMLKALAEGETDPPSCSRLGRSALARHVGRVAGRVGCLCRSQPRLPPTGENGAGAVALDRAANRPTGPGDRRPPSPAPGCRRADGRSSRSGGGLGATNHCRGRRHGGDLPLSEESRFVDGSLSGRRRKRGRESQQTLAERQPPDAPHSKSSCQCCRQTQRKHLRNPLSSFGTAPGPP